MSKVFTTTVVVVLSVSSQLSLLQYRSERRVNNGKTATLNYGCISGITTQPCNAPPIKPCKQPSKPRTPQNMKTRFYFHFLSPQGGRGVMLGVCYPDPRAPQPNVQNVRATFNIPPSKTILQAVRKLFTNLLRNPSVFTPFTAAASRLTSFPCSAGLSGTVIGTISECDVTHVTPNTQYRVEFTVRSSQ